MSEWKKFRLDELAIVLMGQSPPSTSYNTENIGTPFLQGCAEFGAKYPEFKYYCSEPKKIAPENSILLSVRAPVGMINLADRDYVIGRGLSAIIPTKSDLSFLFYAINQNKSKLDIVSQGSTFSAINASDLCSLEIEAPKYSQQCHIAKILSTCDSVIEKTEEAIAKYKAVKQGMLQDLFTRGIDLNTGKLRPKFKEAPELYKESSLGMVPREWEVKKFSSVFEIINGGTPSTHKKEYWDGNIPWLSIEDFNIGNRFVYLTKKKISEEGLKNSASNILQKSMIIISARGTVGVVAQLANSMAFNQSCYGLNSLDSEVTNDYCYYFLIHYKSQVGFSSFGSVFNTITRNYFESIDFYFPKDNAEMTEIVSMISVIDLTIEKAQSNLAKLQYLKQGLMSDLLSGRKRVKVEEES